MATGIESGAWDEMIGEETMAVAVASVSVMGAVRENLRNTDEMTTGVMSSSAMTNVDVVMGTKTACLLIEAIKVGRRPECWQEGG